MVVDKAPDQWALLEGRGRVLGTRSAQLLIQDVIDLKINMQAEE